MTQEAPGIHSRILVIEDDFCYQRLIERCLQRCGVVGVDFSEDGKTGMEKVLAGDYDIVFVDIQLPQLDGFMVATLVREEDCHVPLIAMTSLEIEELKRKAMTVGFNEFFNKPLTENTIFRLLKQYLPLMTEEAARDEHEQVMS